MTRRTTRPSQPNTRLNYLYRDAGNWKTHHAVTFAGVLSKPDRQRLHAALNNQGDGFIPEQIGLLCLVGTLHALDEGLDHPWHEPEEDETWLETVSEAPDDPRTLQAFLAEVLAVQAWDDRFCDTCPTVGDTD